MLINWFFFWIGIVFLGLAKIKSIIYGYSTPKVFPISEFQRCVEYDIKVVNRWTELLQNYTKDGELFNFSNKSILELGPGSDLGAGLYILSKSAKDYTAVDINNLIQKVPAQFYNVFFNYLHDKENIDTSFLIKEFEKSQTGNSDKLNFIWQKDFDVACAMGSHKVDVVLSNCSFEHFENVRKTINDISSVSSPGAIFIALVDMRTHSRWILEKDPNNIYRYPDKLYNFFNFSGIPNRVRPFQYKEALEKNGWKNVKIIPTLTLDNHEFNLIKEHFDTEFHESKNQMNYLSMQVYATKI